MSDNNSSERDIRITKLQKIIDKDIDPYPSKTFKTHTCKEVIEQYHELERTTKKITVAGRIRLLRRHGGSSFLVIEDYSGRLQLYFRKDLLGEEFYNLFKENIDVGDFLEAQGTVFITKTGEKTLKAEKFRLLSKSLKPLPDKWHGLKDLEERYRKRYLDLIVNKDIRDIFIKRSTFIRAIRSFLENKGFLEVETPVLENIPGGAEAEPFITHHNTLDIDLYLRISLELYLKRLIVGGYEKIYEIGPVFRNEGMSTQHLQEFTELEFYWAYVDYEKLMSFVEDLYTTIIKQVFGTLQISYQDWELDFTLPWPRIDYTQIVLEKTGINLDEINNKEELLAMIKNKGLGIEFEKSAGLGRMIDQLYKKFVRPTLIQPTFLINHPLAISPLAKKIANNPKKVERFQVLIAGAEVGNGFSELNNPLEQKERFQEQMQLRLEGDKEAHIIDDDFIEALEYGMPPTAGFGVGIDRLLMILLNQKSIRDVVFFPIMKPKKD